MLLPTDYQAAEVARPREFLSLSMFRHNLYKAFMVKIFKNLLKRGTGRNSKCMTPVNLLRIDKGTIYNILKYDLLTDREAKRILPLLGSIPKNQEESSERFVSTENFFKVLSELKELPIEPEKEKILNLLKEVFSLTENELIAFTFIIISAASGVCIDFFQSAKNRSIQQLNALYCILPPNQVKRVVDSLVNKGLIVTSEDVFVPDYVISQMFNQPFKVTSAEEIIEVFMGKPVVPNLTKENFSFMKDELETCEKIITNALKTRRKGVNILLYGKPGTGKTEFSKLISSYPLYEVLHASDYYGEPSKADRINAFKMIQSFTGNTKSVLLFDEAEDIFNRGFSDNGKSSKGFTTKLLEENKLPVIWITNNTFDVDPAFLRRMTYCVEFKELSEETRLDIWKKVLKENKFEINEEKLKELNYTYPVVPSIISNAVKTTKLIKGDEKDFEKFLSSIASMVAKKKDVKKNDKEDFSKYSITLLNTDTDLKDLTEKIKNSERLDFSMCLYSPPGTGKSLYCNYLADKLGIEVIHKRVSDLVSCWVGQTEQQIRAAFDEAKEKKAMLVFDEADSFFQSRSTAQHSWEVTQVNELLQCMENHKYPFMCTTNIMEGMDEASLRRFSFKVKFDYLRKEQVKEAMKLFFNLDSNFYINGLTPGDFANVQKKTEFMKITDEAEITKMLEQEVELKKDKNLKRSVGF